MPLEKEPKSVKIHKSSGNGMDIEWKDGHESHYSFAFLRDACPCAKCIEERDKDHRRPGAPVKTDPSALPMFKPAVRPTDVEAAGNFAVRFHWNDGHQHGLYSWDYLREICPCPKCEMDRESTAGLAEDIASHERRKPN